MLSIAIQKTWLGCVLQVTVNPELLLAVTAHVAVGEFGVSVTIGVDVKAVLNVQL